MREAPVVQSRGTFFAATERLHHGSRPLRNRGEAMLDTPATRLQPFSSQRAIDEPPSSQEQTITVLFGCQDFLLSVTRQTLRLSLSRRKRQAMLTTTDLSAAASDSFAV